MATTAKTTARTKYVDLEKKFVAESTVFVPRDGCGERTTCACTCPCKIKMMKMMKEKAEKEKANAEKEGEAHCH